MNPGLRVYAPVTTLMHVTFWPLLLSTPAIQIPGSGGRAQGYKPGGCTKVETARQASRAGLLEAEGEESL